jgi:hypothetical protein
MPKKKVQDVQENSSELESEEDIPDSLAALADAAGDADEGDEGDESEDEIKVLTQLVCFLF